MRIELGNLFTSTISNQQKKRGLSRVSVKVKEIHERMGFVKIITQIYVELFAARL